MKKQIRKAHYQHTQKFYSETQQVQGINKFQPVRYSDKRFTAGKYKGYRINEVPVEYVKWVLGNWNGLTVKSIQILSSVLKNT